MKLFKFINKKNPIRFYFQLRKYDSQLSKAFGDCPHSLVLEQLGCQGFCILDSFVSQSELNRIKTDVKKKLIALSNGLDIDNDIKHTSYASFGCYVLHNIESFSTSCLHFAKDDLVNEVVNAYSRGKAVSFGVTAELRSIPAKNDLVDDWHTDTWKFRFKAILYLTDVLPENSPLCYLSGSHNNQHWRWLWFFYNYLRFAFPSSQWAMFLCSRLIQTQINNPAFKFVQCTGKAGTLILFDARGIHRGSPLKQQNRLILNHTYFIPEE